MENYIDLRDRDGFLLRVHFLKKSIEVRFCKKPFTEFYRVESKKGKPIKVTKI